MDAGGRAATNYRMSDLHVRPLGDEDEQHALAAILATCFGCPVAESLEYVEGMRPSNGLVVTRRGDLAGGTLAIRMGQWFGGRSVATAGIASVGVDPSARAGGVATYLMQETVRHLHDEGVALSTLSPSTQPVYRRAGYEQAGGLYRVSVALERLAVHDDELPLRRMCDDDRESVEQLQRERGRRNNGNVDRDEVMWQQVRKRATSPLYEFVVDGADGLEGYVTYTSSKNATGHNDLFLNDVVAATRPAARRIVSFLRDHRSLVNRVSWYGHPADPLLLAMREQRHDVRLWDAWMLRIVHLEAALTQRGYVPGVTAEIPFEITDDVCPGNAGRWMLRVADGRGEVTRGGDGRVRLDVRTLASLYSGWVAPSQAHAGLGLSCSDDDLAALARAFAGSAPWIQDDF